LLDAADSRAAGFDAPTSFGNEKRGGGGTIATVNCNPAAAR